MIAGEASIVHGAGNGVIQVGDQPVGDGDTG
jgi:hypothetical protein